MGIRWLSHIANPDPTPDVYATRYSIFRSPDDPTTDHLGGHLNINVNDAADAYLGTPVVVFADGKDSAVGADAGRRHGDGRPTRAGSGVSDTHTAAFVGVPSGRRRAPWRGCWPMGRFTARTGPRPTA